MGGVGCRRGIWCGNVLAVRRAPHVAQKRCACMSQGDRSHALAQFGRTEVRERAYRSLPTRLSKNAEIAVTAKALTAGALAIAAAPAITVTAPKNNREFVRRAIWGLINRTRITTAIAPRAGLPTSAEYQRDCDPSPYLRCDIEMCVSIMKNVSATQPNAPATAPNWMDKK